MARATNAKTTTGKTTKQPKALRGACGGSGSNNLAAKTAIDAKAKGASNSSKAVEQTDIDAQAPQVSVAGPGDALGQVTWLMANSPMHKHMFLSDLEWLVLPPLMLKQFRIFRKDSGPIAYASWAFLDDNVGARMTAGNVKLAPTEWSVGDQAWLVDLVAPFGGHEQVLKELKEQVFVDRTLKSLQPAPDGTGVAVVEW